MKEKKIENISSGPIVFKKRKKEPEAGGSSGNKVNKKENLALADPRGEGEAIAGIVSSAVGISIANSNCTNKNSSSSIVSGAANSDSVLASLCAYSDSDSDSDSD